MGTLKRPPMINRRKVGMTSSLHASYILGYTRTTMLWTKGSKRAIVSKSHKPRLSSDRRLQLACVKVESLVIPDQHCWSEFVPGSCTHRPSHHGSWFCPKSLP
ncbi:hypothetical protein BV378_34585 [Nostoc sp. RF31YmG]|nr:hypothetical protein BV378_34585 [Nostoc sp. RF31YmG]